MIRRTLSLLLVACMLPCGHAAGQQAAGPVFSVKPPDFAAPSGVPPGQYRRIVQPFKNWTLICDENLRSRTRVCNISQTIIDQGGAVVFSWSLAGTDQGKAVMILRTPGAVGRDKPVTLSFADGAPPIVAVTNGCDSRVCVAVLQVGPRMKAYIARGAVVQISFTVPAEGGQGAPPILVGLYAPLDGLSKAVSSI